MHALARNPINRRLRRASHWPSEVAARWIGGGLGLVIGLASALISYRLGFQDDWSIIIGAELLVLIACLTLCFILSATFMASYIRSGDYALLRLSNLTSTDIVDGYTGGITYRVRVARAIAVWSPFGWAASLFVTIPMGQVSYMLCGLWLATMVVALAAVGQLLFSSMSALMVSAGIWFGLKLGRYAGVLASGLGALAAASVVAAIGVTSAPGLFRCCIPLVAVAAVLVLDSRREFYHDDAVRAVEAGRDIAGLEV